MIHCFVRYGYFVSGNHIVMMTVSFFVAMILTYEERSFAWVAIVLSAELSRKSVYWAQALAKRISCEM
jgi:hypothetical protein